jgi:hypothetical protein
LKNEYSRYPGNSIFSKEYNVPLVTECLFFISGIGDFNVRFAEPGAEAYPKIQRQVQRTAINAAQ